MQGFVVFNERKNLFIADSIHIADNQELLIRRDLKQTFLCLQICKFVDLQISKTLLHQVSRSSISPAMPASEHPCLQPLYAACHEVHDCMLWNDLFLSFLLKAGQWPPCLSSTVVAAYCQLPCLMLQLNPYMYFISIFRKFHQSSAPHHLLASDSGCQWCCIGYCQRPCCPLCEQSSFQKTAAFPMP